MNKSQFDNTITQIAQSIGTFNSTLISLKKGQDEVRDVLMMFREMIAGMGRDYCQIRDGADVLKVAIPRLAKDTKAAEHKRKIKVKQQARYRVVVASKNTCVDTTIESEKEQEKISPALPLLGESEKEKEVV